MGIVPVEQKNRHKFKTFTSIENSLIIRRSHRTKAEYFSFSSIDKIETIKFYKNLIIG